MDESINLNNSVMSNRSANTMNKKYNLKEKFTMDYNMTKFQEFLNFYNSSKNILVFVDSKNNFWEIVKRNDLNMNIFLNNNCENIVSIASGQINTNNNEFNSNRFINIDGEDSPKSKFYNLEIKDRSLNNSEMDISRMTDFNISHFIRDMNDA
jgi:hypothetical protein